MELNWELKINPYIYSQFLRRVPRQFNEEKSLLTDETWTMGSPQAERMKLDPFAHTMNNKNTSKSIIELNMSL